MATTVETIQLRVTADNKQVIAELKRLQRELGTTGAKADSAKTKFAGLGGGIRGLAGAFGIGLGVTALVSMGRSFISLASTAETSLAKVATLADFTTQELDAMRRGTGKLQRQLGISFEQISEARFDVISSGFSDIADQQKILAAAFTLGAGNATDMTVATSTLTGVMSAFGRTADDTNRTMDQLTLIAQNSKTNLEGLSGAITKLAPDAVAAGQSLATAGAALDVLTLAGLSADISATAIGAAMRSIITPAVIKNLDAAKIEVKDLETGAMRPLLDILKDLATFPPEKIRTIIPSEEAQRAISVLLGKLDLFEAKINTIADENAMGVTAAAAAKTMDTLGTQTDILGETFKSLFQEGTFFGEQLKTSIKGLTQEVLILRKIAGTSGEEQVKTATDVEKADARVLELEKDIAFTLGEIEAVQRNLDAVFASGGKIRERQLAFQEQKLRLLAGLEEQLLETITANIKARQEAAFIQPAVFGPTQPLGPFRPPEVEEAAAPQAEKDAKVVETIIQSTRLAIAKQGADTRVEQASIEFDRIIANAEKKNATLEQLETIRNLRSQALTTARAEDEVKAERKALAEQTKIRKEAAQKDAALNEVRSEIFKSGLSEDQRAILELQETWDSRIAALRENGAEEVEINAAITQSIDEVKEKTKELGEEVSGLGDLQEVLRASSIAVGDALVTQAIAGEFSGKALAKAAQVEAQAVLKAQASKAAGLAIFETGQGLAALALSLFPPNPVLATAAAGHFKAAAVFATVAATAVGLAKAVGGGGAVGGAAPGGPAGATAAERRGRRRRMDEEVDRRGGAVVVNQNIQFLAPPTRPQLAQLADLTQQSLRQNFEDRQIDVNLGTVA